MPKLTTVKDLRDLMRANEGEIEFGKFRMSMPMDAGVWDIDVYIDSQLTAWLSKSTEDETILADATTSISSDITTLRKEVSDLSLKDGEYRDTIHNLEKALEGKKENEAGTALLQGKIQAYEKMLIGRGVTISA